MVVFGAGCNPRDSQRSLNKHPIQKCTMDLEWRIKHGAVATNRDIAHIDPRVGLGVLEVSHWAHGCFHLLTEKQFCKLGQAKMQGQRQAKQMLPLYEKMVIAYLKIEFRCFKLISNFD